MYLRELILVLTNVYDNFSIPKLTLQRLLDDKNKRSNNMIQKMGIFAVFSEDVENEIVKNPKVKGEFVFVFKRHWNSQFHRTETN